MKMQEGFTLVELMIVVVVLAILIGVGMPAYNDYVTRGKLLEATSGLSDGRIKMEQRFQDALSYVGAPCPSATAHFVFACATTAPAAGVPSTFTITATGQGNLAAYSYTINEGNAKTSTTPFSNPANVPVPCWLMKNGDYC